MKKDDGSLVQLGDGSWVEDDVLRVVERIQEYDPNLKIQYLPWAGGVDQAPYRLMEHGKDGIWRKVKDVWTLDQRLLDEIVAMDTFKVDILKLLDEENAKARKAIQKEHEETRGQQKELVASIIDSPKDTYTAPVDGEVKKFRSVGRD